MADHDKPVALWLLGALPGDGRAGPGGNNMISGSPGVLERLAEYYPGDPTGLHVVLTLGGAAQRLPRRDSANGATATIEGAPVRVRFDGGDATATTGLLLPVGAVLQLGGQATLNGASFFTASAGGIVQVAFWT